MESQETSGFEKIKQKYSNKKFFIYAGLFCAILFAIATTLQNIDTIVGFAKDIFSEEKNNVSSQTQLQVDSTCTVTKIDQTCTIDSGYINGTTTVESITSDYSGRVLQKYIRTLRFRFRTSDLLINTPKIQIVSDSLLK